MIARIANSYALTLHIPCWLVSSCGLKHGPGIPGFYPCSHPPKETTETAVHVQQPLPFISRCSLGRIAFLALLRWRSAEIWLAGCTPKSAYLRDVWSKCSKITIHSNGIKDYPFYALNSSTAPMADEPPPLASAIS